MGLRRTPGLKSNGLANYQCNARAGDPFYSAQLYFIQLYYFLLCMQARVTIWIGSLAFAKAMAISVVAVIAFVPVSSFSKEIESNSNQPSNNSTSSQPGPSSIENSFRDRWQVLLAEQRKADLPQQLKNVNQYINRFKYQEDPELWQQREYWATPFEFFEKQAGDCEDFVFAKYFSLVALGVDSEQMRITYVKSKTLNRAHMVLAFYRTTYSEPLILDNLDQEIKRASERQDLIPVYSFNGKGIWVQGKTGHQNYAGDVDGLNRWTELLRRMQAQGVNQVIEASLFHVRKDDQLN